MTGATETIGTGLGGWLGHIGAVFAAMPGQYRSRLRQHRGKTIALTILFIGVLVYPWFNHEYLANFSRNAQLLPKSRAWYEGSARPLSRSSTTATGGGPDPR